MCNDNTKPKGHVALIKFSATRLIFLGLELLLYWMASLRSNSFL